MTGVQTCALPISASVEVPATSSHEEARLELRRAYARLNELESQNRRLERRARECKDKYDAMEEKYEKLKKKHDE